MAINITTRLKSAWNAFFNKDPTIEYSDVGYGSYLRPDRIKLTRGNERSIVTSVYNRISMDVCSVGIRHVILDDSNRYLHDFDSGLNNCLTLEANLDQTGRSFIQDIVMSLFDDGCVAVVPTDTDDNPNNGMPGSFDIDELRVGKIVQWYPSHIKVSVYNEHSGKREDIVMSKRSVAIIENPLYAIMNEPNSTLQRLIRKLKLLDTIDDRNYSGKLDMIIQVPYVIKTKTKLELAEERRKAVEDQLAGSKLGIAYVDGMEKIIQLNRPLENNLVSQIEYLTSMLFSQLGITKEILDGTANEQTMLNYNNRTIEPILSAIVDEMKRKFLTKTARSQKHSIMFFKDPFKLLPVSSVAELADKMTRNEIMSPNEIRQAIGMKPSNDPTSDELRNRNLSQAKEDIEQRNNAEMEDFQNEYEFE